jgi:hypothetical protein
MFAPVLQNRRGRLLQFLGLCLLPELVPRLRLHALTLEVDHTLVFGRAIVADRARNRSRIGRSVIEVGCRTMQAGGVVLLGLVYVLLARGRWR